MSLETKQFESISNQFIQQIGNSHIHIPGNFNSNAMNNQNLNRIRYSSGSKFNHSTNVFTAPQLNQTDGWTVFCPSSMMILDQSILSM